MAERHQRRGDEHQHLVLRHVRREEHAPQRVQRRHERDEERHGKDSNAKMFVMLSDGESWSGEVAKSLKLAAARNIPLYVVGLHHRYERRAA